MYFISSSFFRMVAAKTNDALRRGHLRDDDCALVTKSNLLSRRTRGSEEMRKLVVSTFLTLDGVMQAPGGPEEDPTGGFEQGGWSFNYWDDVMLERMAEAMST